MALMQNGAVAFNQDLFKLQKHKECRACAVVGGGVRKREMALRLRCSTKTKVETINGKGDEMMNDEFVFGRFVEARFVFRQAFVIRSYEIGPDQTATMETLMNLLQETALNHVANSGVAGSGFGATREMSLRKLIWVVTRIHVQIHKYSSWYKNN